MTTTERTVPAKEADILGRLLEPGFSKFGTEFARRLLTLKFSPEDEERLHALGAKARAGMLTSEEDEDLETYLRMGHLLNMLRLQARRVLRKRSSKR